MIENFNATKNSSNENFENTDKHLGVASINILRVNPKNADLRFYGWKIADDADEPKYVTTNNEGKPSARVRFLVELEDTDEAVKPVVPMDFWIRPEVRLSNDGTKCQIIDAYGRTAWATKADMKEKSIPLNSAGQPVKIDKNYKPAHYGEAELIAFLMKYLNVTPLQKFSEKQNAWVDTENPGRLTIDNWGELCKGNVKEIEDYVKLQEDNRVKVIFGIRTTDDNKSYQTFFSGDIKSGAFISNGARPNKISGEYDSARKVLDRDRSYYALNNKNYPYIYSAAPVKIWKQNATEVKDNANAEDMPDLENNDFSTNMVDDLPFRD